MRAKIKILLADDDAILRRVLPLQSSAEDFEFMVTESGSRTLSALRENVFDVVLLDINLPDISGLEILRKIRQNDDSPEVIMLTADTALQTGIEAMRRGAYEYLTKPAEPEQVEIIIRKAFEKRNLVKQNFRLRVAVRQQNQATAIEPVHQSPAMKEIFEKTKMVAKIDSTLLLTGESGTGKDILARWIHSQSPRNELPLISVNCGALPENLFESEFFGHVKGSFTGATAQKIGLIEAADGSTLFLDEIGEMPLTMQVKLLHFLENSTFRRVGATRDNQVDVRVIAATNRPLEEDITEGKFRADLFYRLNVVSFHLPPLRQRVADIPILVELLLENFRRRFNRPNLKLSPDALAVLLKHEWRGNVRELRNTLERAVIFSAEDTVEKVYGLENAENVSVQTTPESKSREGFLTLAEIEKQHILEVLKSVSGKREKAAEILGITARTLYRKLNEYQ